MIAATSCGRSDLFGGSASYTGDDDATAAVGNGGATPQAIGGAPVGAGGRVQVAAGGSGLAGVAGVLGVPGGAGGGAGASAGRAGRGGASGTGNGAGNGGRESTSGEGGMAGAVEPNGECGNGIKEPGEACDDSNQQAGDGCSPRCRPEPVALALGDRFSCALSSIGTAKCWGSNIWGELGTGDNETRGDDPDEMGAGLPVIDVGAGRSIVSLDAGWLHICALLDDRSVVCWGWNEVGQLGEGNTEARGDHAGDMGDALPRVDLGTGRTVDAISTSGNSTCALLDDGSVKCWGGNSFGELGLGDHNARGDEPGEMGDALPAVNLHGNTAKTVFGAMGFGCAELDDDTLRCWGDNMGQSPNLGSEHPVKLVVNYDMAGLFADGSVKCWGQVIYGSCGDGIREETLVPSPSLVPVMLEPVHDIDAGWGFKCVLLETNRVKCWGRNTEGALGLGDTEDRGDEPGEMEALEPVDLGPGSVRKIVTGGRHACALFDDASVKCWGDTGMRTSGPVRTRRHGDDPNEMGDALPTIDLVF
jgi:cysteine-rich repeat protein